MAIPQQTQGQNPGQRQNPQDKGEQLIPGRLEPEKHDDPHRRGLPGQPGQPDEGEEDEGDEKELYLPDEGADIQNGGPGTGTGA